MLKFDGYNLTAIQFKIVSFHFYIHLYKQSQADLLIIAKSAMEPSPVTWGTEMYYEKQTVKT